MIHVEVGVSPAQKEFFHVPKVLETYGVNFCSNPMWPVRINLVNWKATRRFVQYQLPAYPLQHEKGMKTCSIWFTASPVSCIFSLPLIALKN